MCAVGGRKTLFLPSWYNMIKLPITGMTSGTRTDLALKMAEEQIFCDTCGTRKDVTKVLVLITDGKGDAGSMPIAEASKGLKVSRNLALMLQYF